MSSEKKRKRKNNKKRNNNQKATNKPQKPVNKSQAGKERQGKNTQQSKKNTQQSNIKKDSAIELSLDSESNKNKTQNKSTLPIVISLISMTVTIIIAINSFQFSRFNASLVLNEQLRIEYVSETEYTLILSARQGGISRAYLVNFVDDKIIYDLINESLRTGIFDLFRGSSREMRVNIGITELQNISFIDLEYTIIRAGNVQEFAIVLQDALNQWHVHYLVVRPPIYLDEEVISRLEEAARNSYEHSIRIAFCSDTDAIVGGFYFGEDGVRSIDDADDVFDVFDNIDDDRAIDVHDDDRVIDVLNDDQGCSYAISGRFSIEFHSIEPEIILIDGRLTNLATIRNMLNILNTLETFDLYSYVQNGEITRTRDIEVPYTLPNYNEIYYRIRRIFSDIIE